MANTQCAYMSHASTLQSHPRITLSLMQAVVHLSNHAVGAGLVFTAWHGIGNIVNLPLSQVPLLKYTQRTLFGSTPNGIFCVCTGLNNAATSALAASAAFFSASRLAFSASFRFCSGVCDDFAWDVNCVICF